MKPLSREDIKVKSKGGDLWEAWITHAPKSPTTRKPVRRYVHALSEDEARTEAFEAFATVYPVLMITGKVDFKDAVIACVDKCRKLGRIKTDKTARDYKLLVQRSLRGLPKTPIDEVSKTWLEATYAHLHRHGGVDGKGVSVKTLRKLNVVVKGAYDYMISQGVNMPNPASGVKFPKPDDSEIKTPRVFTESEWAVFQDAIAEALAVETTDKRAIKRKSALFGSYIAMYTGMRCGEVCGLRRGDVRMVSGFIRVEHSVTNEGELKAPKTKKSMRTIAMGDVLKQSFYDFYRWQATFLTKKQCKSDATPVCCDAKGRLIKPTYLSKQFKKLCINSGIELKRGESIHTLRHTHVSELLTAGESVKAVQERVGHASAATTLDYYAHVMPGEDAGIATTFDGLADRARRAGEYR